MPAPRRRLRRYSNAQLAAIFADLRRRGKLDIRAERAGKHNPWNARIVLRNPEAMIEEARKRGILLGKPGDPGHSSDWAQVNRSWSDRGRRYIKHPGIVLAEGGLEDTRERKSRLPKRYTLLRTHAGEGVEDWARDQRLGTALYVLMLKQAKRAGYAGIYSFPEDRTKDASKVWKNIRTGITGHLSGEGPWDYMTSVRPHARRRGKKLKERKLSITQQRKLRAIRNWEKYQTRIQSQRYRDEW